MIFVSTRRSKLVNTTLFSMIVVLGLWHLLFGCISADNASSHNVSNVSIVINGGANSTSSQGVTLTLSATDKNAVSAYLVSESSATPDASDAGWVMIATPSADYTGTVSFTLSKGYGPKTVYAWFKNPSQYVSSPADADIDLVFVTKALVANPNVIMIVVDTLRADHLSTYGYARNTDPHIADFANQAVVFWRSVSPAPWTMPAYTSILSSKFAFNHNMNLPSETTPNVALLTASFKNAGYHTVTIQTNTLTKFLFPRHYFDEMYSYWDDNSDDEATFDYEFQDQLVADLAGAWLTTDSNTANKFFFFMGMMSPHWEYETDNGYLENLLFDALYKNYSGPSVVPINITHGDGCWTYDMLSSTLSSTVMTQIGLPASGMYYQNPRMYIAGYDSEIELSDSQIGRILQNLKDKGLYDDAIIIITADHGENMMDHEVYFSHGDNLYQSLLRVPLLIKFPRQTTRMDITEHFVRTIDILPTVFDYANIAYSGTDGQSLLPFINGEDIDDDEWPIISYRKYTNGSGNEEVSVIKDNYKLIRNKNNNTNGLYDLTRDPLETTDISSQHPDKVSQLKDFLVSAGSFTAW